MMEEQLLLVGSNIANVVYVRYFTLTGGDSAIIFVDSCDSIRTKVRILVILRLPRILQEDFIPCTIRVALC